MFTMDERFGENLALKISTGRICFRKIKMIKGGKGTQSKTAQIHMKKQNQIW